MSDINKIEDVPSPGKYETGGAEEASVTMIDVLEQEKKLEDMSAAVLGGSDEKFCTHSKGYIKRQALYSCLTCCPEAQFDVSKQAGICLACSYQCHEHHELIELYTKRNFRCDCPTDRIPGKKCSFAASGSADVKLEVNSDNLYNQNFSGVYCTCKRPYPDPDDSIPDEMMQCIMCEDWYHTRHLNASVPPADMYSEMICGDCISTYSFLKDYMGMAVEKVESGIENGDVQVTEDDEKLKSELDKSISDIMPNITPDTAAGDELTTSSGDAEFAAAVEPPAAKKLKIEEPVQLCRRPTLSSGYKKGAVFWPDNWRKSLCSCPTCTQMYANQKVSFLLDIEDTVQFYEENGLKKSRETDYERGIRALSRMDRSQQIDAITEYNRMKDKLKEFLHTFVVNQKVVTEDDINSFFQSMKNEKKTSIGLPYLCR